GMALPERDPFPPQKICMAWQQTRNVGRGLYNLGNTCFLNSILQCLTYTPPLANYLLSLTSTANPVSVDQGFSMMCTMEVHIEEVLSCSGSATEPMPVIRIGEHFQLGTQEDAHKFFYTVDTMQRACLSRSISLLPNLRSMSLCLPVMSLSCKALSDTYEAFLDIPLDIKVRRFEIMVQNVSRPLQGAQFISSKLPASKRLTIHHSSNVLTACLKRFDAFSGRKISKVVQYLEYLDLGAYMSQVAGEPLLYSLYAVLVHEVSGCQTGHYYCFIKASDGRWYKMNEASVVLCDIKTVLCQCAIYCSMPAK
ncbi:Ubiquitin carboxyl-terminal hydrolase 42, partial [Spheniscus demersus]